MKSLVVFSVLLCSLTRVCSAALIPYYEMDGFAYISDEIILVKETGFKEVTVLHGGWSEKQLRVVCEIIKRYKGGLQEGNELELEYSSVFKRRRIYDYPAIVKDKNGNVIERKEPERIPLGKSLVFLRKANRSNRLHIVSAKIILEDQVYQYGQFNGNPGPLVLAPQYPENISIGQKYLEREFLEDFEIALEKSKSLLQKPKHMSTWRALHRKQ